MKFVCKCTNSYRTEYNLTINNLINNLSQTKCNNFTVIKYNYHEEEKLLKKIIWFKYSAY